MHKLPEDEEATVGEREWTPKIFRRGVPKQASNISTERVDV
jgi:hypothetical protein